ncbi:RNA-binding protein 7 [Synchiropus splendidus]|uniref:RNA-binding protein 7 n=1 Tax=Synchiropus splendidus TaxID=270530 RepID=UPI00237D69E2|nr:RNA-binding protein 7 [Synchiropus splendidus]
MGIEEEADRTLFIRNIDSRVTEELLFELCLQAGPLIRTKIPRDPDGKQKTFGFAVYKHEVTPPYAIQLLDGTSLFGRNIHVQHRSGSNHHSSQNANPANTPNPHGQRTPQQFSSPPYTPPPSRSFHSPDNLQKQVMMNNMMWQTQMQMMSDGFSQNLQRPDGGSSGSRQNHGSPYRPYHAQGRSPRHPDEAGHRQPHGHNRSNYHHQNYRSGGHHRDGKAGSRHDRDWRW